ncbi:hypothetical protein ASE25_19335 [Terrabacter sp. Root85]|uniref:hypothetical protein n=1 Tax=Terrabacter sp. Root85 TaxID=1736603 RepID=UPI0006F5F076|nr:hypothetical protein [Terrabacter sp. Root85]KRC85205.1 hypothetical protein ASE25_19335 [Terrabacter sp. Root85]
MSHSTPTLPDNASTEDIVEHARLVTATARGTEAPAAEPAPALDHSAAIASAVARMEALRDEHRPVPIPGAHSGVPSVFADPLDQPTAGAIPDLPRLMDEGLVPEDADLRLLAAEHTRLSDSWLAAVRDYRLAEDDLAGIRSLDARFSEEMLATGDLSDDTVKRIAAEHAVEEAGIRARMAAARVRARTFAGPLREAVLDLSMAAGALVQSGAVTATAEAGEAALAEELAEAERTLARVRGKVARVTEAARYVYALHAHDIRDTLPAFGSLPMLEAPEEEAPAPAPAKRSTRKAANA